MRSESGRQTGVGDTKKTVKEYIGDFSPISGFSDEGGCVFRIPPALEHRLSVSEDFLDNVDSCGTSSSSSNTSCTSITILLFDYFEII